MAEFVREKVLKLTRDEIPYTVTCYTENYEENEDIVNISVVIIIEKSIYLTFNNSHICFDVVCAICFTSYLCV